MTAHGIMRVRFEIFGIVQGVGFRPFIKRLAETNGIAGFVANNSAGVVIEAAAGAVALAAFERDITRQAPTLARIEKINRVVLDAATEDNSGADFRIVDSRSDGKPQTLMSPDVCVCDACLSELFTPDNRRYLYPFINCTDCGPRFTIIENLPYDRPLTTMKSFAMCDACSREYNDTADRRYHAQPIACPSCGPRLSLIDSAGRRIDGDPLLSAVELLRAGKIVAVKGLGGFHLAVDATRDEAVRRLRRRKRREEKPLAVMIPSVEVARTMATMNECEERHLKSSARPIVLLRQIASCPLAPTVAPGNPYIGLMLPYTPLHYLLFFHPQAGGDYAASHAAFSALVMTSGNISDEPICTTTDEVLRLLAGVADAVLTHDRPIEVRADDSVGFVEGDTYYHLRRSRGFAPVPMTRRKDSPVVLACGAELKNTVCLAAGRRAFVSQHIGDLEHVATLDVFRDAVEHFCRIYDVDPRVIAYDVHPEYLSTKYAGERIDAGIGISGIGVQHHHAHIASVMAEHDLSGPVLGLAIDGTGYGSDGAIWGGEILLCTEYDFHRLGHLDYVPLPGGTAAIREPWRMAFAYLRHALGDDWRRLHLPCLRRMTAPELLLLDAACASGLNSPACSSLGRLFDAVSAILDICQVNAYEGQAAMMLEAAAHNGERAESLPFVVKRRSGGDSSAFPEEIIIDYRPAISSLVERLADGDTPATLARAFHETVCESLCDALRQAREVTGITTLAISGGCWQNRLLRRSMMDRLAADGFTLYLNESVPAGDGGISLGQALSAAAIAERQKERG